MIRGLGDLEDDAIGTNWTRIADHRPPASRSAVTGRPSRIGILTTSFPRFPGDLAANFVYQCCRELQRNGLEVRVAAPHTAGAPIEERMDGIRVERFRYLHPPSLQRVAYGTPGNLRRSWLARLSLPLFLFSLYWSARRLAHESDVLHAHWIPSGLIALATRPFGGRPPVVVSVWGSDVALLRAPFLGRLVRVLLRRVAAVIAVSETMKRELVGLGLRPERVVVVLSAATDLPRPQVDREQLRRQLGLPAGRPVVLYLGRLSPEKGPHLLLDAARRVVEAVPEVQFALVGDGNLRPTLEATVDAQGLRGHVLFAGLVPHHEVGAWLAAADVLVLPSLSEGLPHTVMEAMAFSLPVVATAVGGVPEIVHDGVSGYVVPPAQSVPLADRLVDLLRDPERRRRFGEAGADRFREMGLNWERVAALVLEVYEKALAQEPRLT